ncbi:MAG: hypothetical protein E7469_02400 [Ruminococcaceae bacterium]|nr:hypothetical protein [Oscillospiraceae bacterium]
MKRVIGLLLCVVLLVLLGISVVPDGPDEAETLSLYFPVKEELLSGGGDAVTTVRIDWREMRSKSAQEQAEAALHLLLEGYQDSAFGRVLPGSARLLSCQVSGSTATVDFSAAYGQLSGIDLTIADYCIALSLVQIPGIYTVRITVNGRELAYRDKNYFRADDVLVTSPEDVVRNLAVQLYFPNGGLLVAEERILTIYEGESQAEAVIEALLTGPENEALKALLPEGFSVLGVRVEGDLCYINLPQSSEELLPSDSAAQRLTVQGLVRSLCSIREVRQVQLLVEGERRATWGTVDISQPFGN